MFKYVMIVAYPFIAIGLFLLMLLAWILSPFLAIYSVIACVDVLPGILQGFSTDDATLDGGIDQYEYPNYFYKLRHSTPKEPQSTREWPILLRNESIRIAFYRMRWICRNPAQGFSNRLFSAKDIQLPIVKIYDFGDSDIKYKNHGYLYTAKNRRGIAYFSLKGRYWVGRFFAVQHYFGWKLTRDDGYYIAVFSITIRVGKWKI